MGRYSSDSDDSSSYSSRREHSRSSRSKKHRHRHRSRSRSSSSSSRRQHSSRHSSSSRTHERRRKRNDSRKRSHRSRSRSYSSSRLSAQSGSLRSRTESWEPISVHCSSSDEEQNRHEKAELQLQKALKAAAAADKKLSESGQLSGPLSNMTSTIEQQQQRANAIADIEADGFELATFRSSRTEKKPVNSNHVFVNQNVSSLANSRNNGAVHDSIMAPRLHVSTESKMAAWIEKLSAMRKALQNSQS